MSDQSSGVLERMKRWLNKPALGQPTVGMDPYLTRFAYLTIIGFFAILIGVFWLVA